MLLMKFDNDWPAGLRYIHVESVDGRKHEPMDGQTPARVPYYKLTLSLRLIDGQMPARVPYYKLTLSLRLW